MRDLWNNSRVASAHYQVEADGVIGQLVNDVDTAWHAANADINARSIGIEHANISGPNRWQISDATVEEGAHLVAALCHGYNLGRPRWGVNVFGHSQFAATSCPHQLAPGGEDHDHYMRRAAHWYDHIANPGSAEATPEEGITVSEADRIIEFIKGYVAPIGSDTKDVRQQLTGGRDAGEYPGWAQLGQNADGENLTLVDAIAALRRDVNDLRKGTRR